MYIYGGGATVILRTGQRGDETNPNRFIECESFLYVSGDYVVTFPIWLLHQKAETCLGSGAQRWNRTTDTRIFSPLLYRLSYLGTKGVAIVYN